MTKMTNNQRLNDKAMLVSLSIRQWSAAKTDKKVTREVADQHGSDVSMGKYQKALIAKGALETIKKIAGETRTEFYRRTLPWLDDGARILTATGYLATAEYIRAQQQAYDAAVSTFLDSYDQFVADARQRLNGLFDQNDYPSFAQLKAKFGFTFGVRPIPEAEDFRADIGDEELARVKADLEADKDATIKTAMSDVWSRMRDVVGKMAERLKAYNPNKPGDAPFRDTLVSNISDLLAVLPSLNLTGDPNVARFTAEIQEQLTAHSAEELRANMFTLQDTARRAEEILAKMEAYI
jgi:hypothetical protein